MITAITTERPEAVLRDPVAGWSDSARRRVIVHYHILKNAGTSLDDTFKEAFGAGWINVESRRGHHLPPAELASHIRDNKDGVVFSSHTAAFPVPEIDQVSILPIVFVRHPIDRIRSIYSFERRQVPVRTLGALMAKVLPFTGYVRWRLRHDRLIRNFHVERLSQGSTRPGTLTGALEYLDRLPFVGVVEHFEASLNMVAGYVNRAFPEVLLRPLHANARRKRETTLEERIAATRTALGEPLYNAVLEANREDLTLYNFVCRRMGFARAGVDAVA